MKREIKTFCFLNPTMQPEKDKRKKKNKIKKDLTSHNARYATCDMRWATSNHPVPATRVYAGECILFPSTSTSNSTGIRSLFLSCAIATTVGLGSRFPVFLLVHLLRGALPLVVEFYVLCVDLGLAILGFPASAGTVLFHVSFRTNKSQLPIIAQKEKSKGGRRTGSSQGEEEGTAVG